VPRVGLSHRLPGLLVGLFLVLIVMVRLPESFYRNVWAFRLNKLMWSEDGAGERGETNSGLVLALDRLQRDLTWAPRAESTRKLLGVAYHHAGQVEAALREWQGLPDLTDYVLTWGDSTRAQGWSDQALEWYLLASRVEPSSSLAWYRVGQVSRDQARWSEALSAFRRALEEDTWGGLDEERANAYHQAASLLFRGSRWAEALSLLQEALSIAPDSADLWGDLAWASYQSDGDFAQALIYIQRALELDPNDVDLLLRAGDLYRLDEQYDEAFQWAVQARDIAPDNVWTVVAQGRIEFDRGDYATAVRAFSDAVTLAPDTARAYFWLGRAYQADSQWTAAVEAYKTAFELEPQLAEFGLWLGDAYRQTGMLDEAIATYQQVLVYHPDQPGARRRLQEVLELE